MTKEIRERYRSERTWECIVGCVLLLAGRAAAMVSSGLLAILLIAGIALILRGSYCWAKYKGRSGWWALFGLLAPIGFIALAVIEDKGKEEMKTGMTNKDVK